MKPLSLGAVITLGLCTLASAQDPPERPAGDDVPKADYSHFSKLVQSMVTPHVPKYFEDLSGWGGSIPVPPDLRLPKLRTYIKVGDRIEVPHGLWKKFRIWIDDPTRDVQVHLRDMKRNDDGALRLKVEANAFIHGEGEVQPWQKGLGLPVVKADADMTVNLQMEVDVKLTLNTKKFPPDLTVEPWIVSSKLQLQEFHLKRVASIIAIEGDLAKSLGDELKGLLNGLIQQYEEEVTDRANQAIARSIQAGKGTLSAGELLKMLKAK